MYNSYVHSKSSLIFLSRIEKSFFQIYICLMLILFAWTSFSIIRFPFGMDYGEAPLMDQVRRIQNHETVYKASIDEAPYIIANYPPLYTLLVAALNSIFKIQLFQTGRVVSIFFSLISGGIIGLFGYHLTHNKLLGALAAVLFWGNPYVLIWSSLARVDMMALAFSLLGLWVLYRSKNSFSWMILAIICFIAAIFTRQTYLLSGPLAGFVLLWHQNHRRALLFIFLIGVTSLLIFGMINAITQGGFYTNIVVANINRYELSRTLLMFKQLFVLWPIILITSIVTIFMMIRLQIQKKDDNPVEMKPEAFLIYGLGFYSIGAVFSALTVGKVGSDVNYFLELISVCAIWCVIGLKLLLDQNKVFKLIFHGLMSIQLIWVFLAGYTLNHATVGARWGELAFYDDLYSQVQEASTRGIVLSDDYLDLVVLSGQSIYYQPFEYGQLYHAGLWDPTEFAEEIKQQIFPLILIGGDTLNKECCWAPPIVNALRTNYQIEAENNVLILTPSK